MKNDLNRQFFNLSISFLPFIKGERGLTVLLSNWQNNFWTCHFFYWGQFNFIVAPQNLKSKKKNSIYFESQTPDQIHQEPNLRELLFTVQKGPHFLGPSQNVQSIDISYLSFAD